MGLAIRRSSRVGRNEGDFLEDEGVKRDVPYAITRNDILNHDQDLLRFASGQLGAQPTRSLKIVKAEILPDGAISLIVETLNLYRIDCFVDGLPQCSFAVVDGVNIFWVPTGGLVYLPPSQIHVDSYAKVTDDQTGIDELQLIAKATSRLDAAPSDPQKQATGQAAGT